MNSRRPYLMRALYEWICDNACTPYLLVATSYKGLVIPEALRGDEKLVLNLGPNAVRNLAIERDGVSFDARFSGVAQQVYVPTGAVLAIYARENGEGMAFEAVGGEEDSAALDEAARRAEDNKPGPDDDGPTPPGRGGPRPKLSVVK